LRFFYLKRCVENSKPKIETVNAVEIRIENSVKPPIQSQCIKTPSRPKPWHSRIPHSRTSEVRGYFSRKNKMPNEAAEKRNSAANLKNSFIKLGSARIEKLT
jgi:hypothetical protein